jgi:xanthine dehydrogenase YagR molybdenum-binding subunit
MSSVTINGRPAQLPDDPDALLVDVLRDDLALTGTKLVCGAGVCGACTVLLDGVPIVSCLTPAKTVAGRQVTTVEGIGEKALHPVQKAFMALDALQCGFCTPGQLMAAVALLSRESAPSVEQVRHAMSGNLCRCGTYPKIARAVQAAAATLRADAAP